MDMGSYTYPTSIHYAQKPFKKNFLYAIRKSVQMFSLSMCLFISSVGLDFYLALPSPKTFMSRTNCAPFHIELNVIPFCSDIAAIAMTQMLSGELAKSTFIFNIQLRSNTELMKRE